MGNWFSSKEVYYQDKVEEQRSDFART